MSDIETSFASADTELSHPASTAIATPERPVGRRRSDRIVGASQNTQQCIEQLSATARSDLQVLFVGPTGVGKQHMARALHAWSNRATGPFVVLPTAGIPESRIAEELFGSLDPASPLLSGSSAGAIESAAGGTLLVQRVDLLPQAVRPKLISALREGSFRRAGQSDGEAIPVRARVLGTAESGGAELLGELPSQVISIASLAERREDILPLAAHFLAEIASERGLSPVGFTAEARQLLLEEKWSANARELRERIRLALELAGQGAISAEALMLATDGETVPSFKEAKRAFETRYVEGLLRRCNGNISRAARLAKKDRKDFYDVIRRTGIDPSDFRP